LYGNMRELVDVGMRPGKSCLFFLTTEQTLESDQLEIGFVSWESTVFLQCPVPP
jgi:hypothetical protein